MAHKVIVGPPGTPVDTGNLRGSWYATLNDPFDQTDGGNRSDPVGSFTVSQITAQIRNARLGDKIFLLNLASYAKHVEFGTETQRPQAFIRGAVEAAPRVAAETVRRIQRLRRAA